MNHAIHPIPAGNTSTNQGRISTMKTSTASSNASSYYVNDKTKHRYKVVATNGDTVTLENDYGKAFTEPLAKLMNCGYRLEEMAQTQQSEPAAA